MLASDGAKCRIFQLAVCVRKNSNRFRPKFVGWAKFPLDPPFRPPAEATLSDWAISSFSLAENSF
jgi:hypothetical protein